MIKSETISGVVSALTKARKELTNLYPTKQGYGYKYADLAQIIDHTKPILENHGLVIVQNLINESEGQIGVETILFHESGEYIGGAYVLPLTDLPKGTLTQAMGASITYGRRYALAAILGIATDEDIDASPKAMAKQEPASEKSEAHKILDQIRGVAGKREDKHIVAGLVKGAGQDIGKLKSILAQVQLGTLDQPPEDIY